MSEVLKGDFIGFWLDNTHSSELGIIRTSDGSRFNENLLPTVQDKTVQVPGGDGFYYFGSYYTQRPFNIPIAFDNMTEVQFRRLRQIIGTKKMLRLVYDEMPYKYYSVKPTGTPNLKYICFDNNDGSRVYKGEGTLSFVAYDPFGYARALSIAELTLPKNIQGLNLNTSQWSITINDDTGSYNYPLPDETQTGAWVSSNGAGTLSGLVNSGDLPCDYQIICVPDAPPATGGQEIVITDYQFSQGSLNAEEEQITLILRNFTLDTTKHNSFCFDSKTGCVYGCNVEYANNKIKPTTIDIDYGTIYNRYLIAANFSKMPVGSQNFYTSGVSVAPYVNIKFRYF